MSEEIGEIGFRDLACVCCGALHTRTSTSTWHCGQCDDCIVRWAYDKAVRDADKVITDGSATEDVVKYHTRNVEQWRASMRERGLLP